MLGIDVSKPSLECTLLDRETERRQWRRTYANTAEGVTQLLAATPPDVPWVLEPTGRYSLQVAQQAQAAGRKVLLAPPRKAKAYLNSLQDRAKTDRLDSEGLAWFALTRPKAKALRSYPVNTEAVEELQQLLTARQGIVQALTSLRQRQAELTHAADLLEPAIAALAAQEAALDTALQTAVVALAQEDVQRLQAVVGIGPVTATAVAARLHARKFAHADQWVAYIGLDIGVVQSGQRKGERGLTKQGDAQLRRLFYMCAKSAIRSKKGPFQAEYARLRAQGRKPTAALCIIARKLAKLSWSLVKHGAQYDAAKVYPGQPFTPEAPPAAATKPARRAARGGTPVLSSGASGPAPTLGPTDVVN